MTNRYVIIYDGPGASTRLFWRPESAGYTTQILEAGTWSQKDAERIASNRPKLDRAKPLQEVLEALRMDSSVVEALVEVWTLRGF